MIYPDTFLLTPVDEGGLAIMYKLDPLIPTPILNLATGLVGVCSEAQPSQELLLENVVELQILANDPGVGLAGRCFRFDQRRK